mmetsp:Transcript_62125/g.134887  ORF Transcript_62125/g.134887 Transcript_62125/m.134887 type:complete len:219 (-) Transcript_62125:742-1398(-)
MRVDDVAVALRHLPTVGSCDEAMDDEATGNWELRAHQHGGPVHCVEPDDVLPDNVHVSWPKVAQGMLLVVSMYTTNVVDERIEPDIHDVLIPVYGILWTFYPPSKGASTDGEVPQLYCLQPLEHLVAVLLRLHEVLVTLDELDDGVLVFGEAEEEARFRHPLQWLAGSGVEELPFLGFLIGDEALLSHQIPALVLSEIDVAILPAMAPYFSRTGFMLL